MQVVHGRIEGSSARQPSADFTGAVWIDPVLDRTDGVAVNSVAFSPGARTHWHRHESGQALYVTAGEGWVGTRDGEPVRVRTGDTVWAPPGEEHWHGATRETFLVHLGVTLGVAEFHDPVSEAEYPGPAH
jgi:quercetin dioxygenase-like cupin family protein